MRPIAGNGALLAFICALVCPSAGAEDWLRYENSNFVGFSNASRKDAVDVLTELEYIRAAVSQTPSFYIPEGGPKTTVLLPATMDELTRLAPYETMAGFAQPLDVGVVIVLSTSSRGGDARVVARHEFAHTMLFNDWFRYPNWYAEGFSEIVSSISVDRRRNRFTIGERPDRYGRRIRPLLDWNQIIQSDFDAHQLPESKLIQAAYSQEWLLMHYLTQNGERDFASEMDQYFGLITSGMESDQAFIEAFDIDPASLWESRLKQYERRPPSTRHDFDPSGLDLQFDIGDADAGEYEPLLTYLSDKADARRPGTWGMPSLQKLPGKWDQLKTSDQCGEPLTFRLRPDENIVIIDGFYSTPDSPQIPALFEYRKIERDAFQLVNVTEREYPNVVLTNDYRLSMRNENVFCFDEMPLRQVCGAIFQRCDRRN
jgi:hypothetical protein